MPVIEAPPFTPTSADVEAYTIVKQQFGVCTQSRTFFDDFYKDFTSQSSEIARAFEKTDMRAQKEALRDGLAFLIMYAKGNAHAGRMLDRIGGTHSRARMNIRPQLYPLWVNALVRAVKKAIPTLDRTSETAWRHILQLGVDRIQSYY